MKGIKVLIRSLVLMAVLAISAFGWGATAKAESSQNVSTDHLSKLDAADITAYRWNDAVAMFSVSQRISPVDLRTLSASDISAYRWNAMGKFYASQESLSLLNSADIYAYRWIAMGKFYESQALSNIDLRSLNAADISAYRWEAMAKFYVSKGIWLDEASLDKTGLSTFYWVQGFERGRERLLKVESEASKPAE